MTDIINLIDDMISNLQTDEKSEELQLFEELFKNIKDVNEKKISDFPIKDLIFSIAVMKNKNFEEAKKDFDFLKIYFEDSYKNDSLTSILDFYYQNDIENRTAFITTIQNLEDLGEESIMKIIRTNDAKKIIDSTYRRLILDLLLEDKLNVILTLIHLLEKYQTAFSVYILIINFKIVEMSELEIKTAKRELEIYKSNIKNLKLALKDTDSEISVRPITMEGSAQNEGISSNSEEYKITKLKSETESKEKVEERFDSHNMAREIVAELWQHKLELCKTNLNNKKHSAKMIKALILLKAYLQSLNLDDYIYISKDKFKNVPDTIVKNVIMFCTFHNYKVIVKLEQEIEVLKDSPQSIINSMLERNKIKNDFTILEKQQLLEHDTINELEIKLSVIGTLGQLPNNLFLTLIGFSEEDLNLLKELLITNSIEISFLEKLPNFDIKQMFQNYTVIRSFGITLKQLNALLLNDSEKLNYYLKLAQSYNLDLNNVVTLNCLFEPNFFDGIDLFIEQGLGEFIISSPELHGYDLTLIIKRIIIYRNVQYPLFNENNELRPELYNGSFMIFDNNLDEYLNKHDLSEHDSDYEILKNSERLDLASEPAFMSVFSIDSNTYQIENNLISKNKFLRNLNVVPKSTAASLTFGSIKSKEEYEMILKKLEELNPGRRKTE